MNAPLLSVIIPTCYRPDLLSLCLERLAPGAQTLDATEYEVIVSDDGVPTVERLLAERFPWALWVQGPRRGPAANRNCGAGQSRGEWLAFTDDDCLPTPGWLSAYAQAIESGMQVYEGKTSACGIRTRVDMECPINLQGGYLWSCNFVIRKRLFESLEGFDESFPAPAMEDVDLRVRLRKWGVVAEFVPSAEVGHPWRQRKGMAHARQAARSVVYFLQKHPDEAAGFSTVARSKNLARAIFSHLPRTIRNAGIRGVFRDLAITLYFQSEISKELRRRLP